MFMDLENMEIVKRLELTPLIDKSYLTVRIAHVFRASSSYIIKKVIFGGTFVGNLRVLLRSSFSSLSNSFCPRKRQIQK